MQTLRKKSSPFKYKNDPSRFVGEGITFKAKLIGILEVNEARGDKICQDALNDLKTAIRAAGEHKQKITIGVATEGLKLRDEKTGDCLYHHPVHKISFIAQDMTDSRAFGYIFGSPDTGHRFFGIKTERTASQVVLAIRDLFQVVFEMKKREIEMAKEKLEHKHIRYITGLNIDTLHHLKNEYTTEKGKAKYPHVMKFKYIATKSSPESSAAASHKGTASEAIADLLDLEHELNNIQQGINQMERITPSDPFGPLAREDPFSDLFEVTFPYKVDDTPPQIPPKSFCVKARTTAQTEAPVELDKQGKVFQGASSLPAKPTFLAEFSTPAKTEETHWFDQETESLFDDRSSVTNVESMGAALTFPAPEKFDIEQGPEDKSPIKPDVFMELDPLGSGWVKPYVDKKDFFQDLKNPQKKVLKELLTDNYSDDSSHQQCGQAEAAKVDNSCNGLEQSPARVAFSSEASNALFQTPKESISASKFTKMDPFNDTDPFEKTDPFSEKSFGSGIPSIFNEKSFEAVFPEASTFDIPPKEEESPFPSSSIHGPLRVNLPPEKSDTNTPITLSSITSKFRTSPSPPESTRRKNYKVLRQNTDEKGDELTKSPIKEEFFCTKVSSTHSPKTLGRKTSSTKTKFWSDDFESAPNPPPKSALYSIKPPPLPPKKQPQAKPPARPPSLEEKHNHYDLLYDDSSRTPEPKSPGKKSKRLSGKSSIPTLPPPPSQKKTLPEKSSEEKPARDEKESVLNITLNQLDNTGLENLAVTLGIPSDHIYNMTLQELTTRLSTTNLNSRPKQPETFKADFESNFKKAEINDAPEYDRYAAFKELIEIETKTENRDKPVKEEAVEVEKPKLTEDRYAALRQLSMNPQKSENLSEDLDFSVEEDNGKADNMSDAARPKTADSFTPMNSLELPVESPSFLDKEDKDGEDAVGAESLSAGKDTTGVTQKIEGAEKPSEVPFPENPKEDARDNWATFDKLSLYEASAQGNAFNDADNSPLSSDGKEDSFGWRKKSKPRMRSEKPWQEEEESWEEYSAKESYWSEESSHDDLSVEKRRDGKYPGKTCGKQIRKSKGDKCCRRTKWNEDTEDEYEDSWKNHRHRQGACSKERKNETCLVNDWYDGKNKSWEDEEKHARWCRKKSESDDEYRRRCDSDTSDREYIWTSKRSFPDGHPMGEKKQYYMMSRDYPERCHEPRSKHRKAESHKRPSSASEGKRSYEKMSDHMMRGKRGTDDDHPPSYHKDFRYCCPESAHHHNSYDRRAGHCKKSSRTRRGDMEQYGMEAKDKKSDNFDYYKSAWHKDDGRKNRRYHFEDDFAPAAAEKAQPKLHSPKREASKSPRRGQRQRDAREGFFRAENNNESFDNAGDEFKPQETYRPQDGATEKEQGSKQQIFNKNHFGALARQESSASLRKSESINIFSRENDPFEGDDFFSSTPPANQKLSRFQNEKSRSNSNVTDSFSWKEVFGESPFHD